MIRYMKWNMEDWYNGMCRLSRQCNLRKNLRAEGRDILHSQVSFLRQFCNARGLIIDQCILHVFSCRLYGLRKYKKQIEGDVEIAKELQDGNKSNQRTESENK